MTTTVVKSRVKTRKATRTAMTEGTGVMVVTAAVASRALFCTVR